ncbi:MAG: FecR domain-containing protein [Cyanobacteria bacterium J06636_28]
MRKVSARWCSLLLGTSFLLGTPSGAIAQTSLTWAKVESLRNRVHLIPNGNNARLARVSDVMSIGDALRTAASARAELRFNDGSLARVGEQATFRFTPDTRNFQLSNGTVLLLIPPGRGRTTIQTPNAVTGIQGSALFVRVRCLAELTAEGYCSSPVTFVGALTNNPAGAMVAYNESGSQQQPIHAGEMVIIEDGNISQRLEFDLRTFYETSGLAAGLALDSPTPPTELSDELQEVWQEIQDALELQGDFDNRGSTEEVVENPDFITAPIVSTVPTDITELDVSANSDVFAGFPGFSSSPAATFHGLVQVTASQTSGTYTTETTEISESSNTESGLVAPITSARVRATLGAGTPTVNQVTDSSTVSSPVASQPSPGVSAVAPISEVPASANTSPPTIGTPSAPTAPTTSGIEAVVTPQTVDNVVDLPVTPVESVPEVAPIENPVVTPTVDVVPTPVETVTPVVEPASPVTVPTTDVVTVPEQQPVIPEADQAPVREAVPESAFDWQPAGANDPEVLQTSDVPINEASPENIPESQPETNTGTNIQI